ncbi:glycosyltransferase, partial [Thermus sp. SYSU G05001]
MPKKVVFLRAKPIAPEPRVEKAAETLAQVGYTVTALGWDREGNHPHEEKRNGYTVHHIGPRGLHGGGIYNLLPMVLWQKDLFLWLWRKRHQYTHIHATDLDTILPALLIKLLLGKRVVYDIFDVFAFSRDLPDWMKALAHRLELWAIGKADAVILPDPSRREQILGARPKRLEVIINTPKLTNITLDMGHEGYESTHFPGLYPHLRFVVNLPLRAQPVSGTGGDPWTCSRWPRPGSRSSRAVLRAFSPD